MDFLKHYDDVYRSKLSDVHPIFKDRAIGFRKIFEELLKKDKEHYTIVEAGSIRKKDNWGDGQSSLLFWDFISLFGGKLICIDKSAKATTATGKILKSAFPTPRHEKPKAILHIICGDAVQVLDELDEMVDLVYLDSVDICADEPECSQSMVHHLKLLASLQKIITKSPGLLIAIDDNFDYWKKAKNYRNIGKGQYIVEWAKTTKNKIIYEGYQQLIQMTKES